MSKKLSKAAKALLKGSTVDKNIVTISHTAISGELQLELKEHFSQWENEQWGCEWLNDRTVQFKEVPEDLFAVLPKPPAPPAPKKRSQSKINSMSKVTIQNDALKAALAKAREVISKNPTIPCLSNVLVQVSGTSLKLICTDIEVTLIMELSCENEEQAQFDTLIPFDFLNNIVHLNRHTSLTLETDANKARLTGFNDEYEIEVLDDVTEFPKLPTFPDANELVITNDFVSIVNAALASAGSEKETAARPVLQRVLLEFDGNDMTIASTNTAILFSMTLTVDQAVDERVELVISPKVAKAIKGFTNTAVYWGDNHIAFRSDNVTVIANKFDDKYVAYKSVIPADRTIHLEVDRLAFIEALSKAMVSADSKNTVSLRLKNSIGVIKVEGHNTDFGRNAVVDMPADYTGDCDEIRFNGKYMATLLGQVNYENISLSIPAYNKAILLMNANDSGYLALIMPIFS